LWCETVRQRKPVVVNDYAKLSTWKKGYPKGHVEIRRYLGIPVFDGERIVAVASVANNQDDYDNGDVRQLTLLMDSMWRLIERKRAEETLQQAHDDLEDQVESRTAVLMATNKELRQEIVQRALAEKALREKEEQYRTLVETLPHGIQEIDLDGTITFASAACHRLYGFHDGAMVGTRVWDVIASRVERNSLQKNFKTMVNGQKKPTPYFGQDRTKDGKVIDVRVDWDYKRDNAGELTGIVAVLTDITDQCRAEEQARRRLDDLAHVVRLSTMGEMVSGLAHELNQPLAAIAGYAQACQHQVQILKGESRDEVLDFVGQISEQANRAGEIIRHLRDFVRRADSGRSPIDINDLICDVAALLEVEMRLHDVCLNLDLDHSLPEVNVDRIQIEQVVTNLVYNAIEATKEIPREYRAVTVRTSLKGTNVVEIAVEDTGKGLQTKNIDRLFEPFYTTKENGMGLGLSISRSIVESHGGRLKATPDAERGTTFRFTLLSAQGEGDEK